jgi:hypothetical protein
MIHENDMSSKNSSISLIIFGEYKESPATFTEAIPAESRANTWPLLLGKFLVAKIYLKKREFQREAF